MINQHETVQFARFVNKSDTKQELVFDAVVGST